MSRDTKWRWLATLVTAAAVPALLVAYLEVGRQAPEEATTSVFDRAGFVVLRPAITYHVPGSFNTVEKRLRDSVILHPTCEIDARDFEDRIIKADTVDETIKQKLALGYQVEPGTWGRLNLGVELGAVRSIRVSYANSQIWQLSTEAVEDLRRMYLRNGCEAAVVRELKNGLDVCQSKSVVVSDVVYLLSYGADIASGTAILDTEGSVGETSMTRGEKIFHAVKLQSPCILLRAPADATAQGDSARTG